MTESNTVEQQPKLILEVDDYPTVHPVVANLNGNNSNNYQIDWSILKGNNEKVVDMFENSITLNQEDLKEFDNGFEILKYIHNFQADYTAMEKERNGYAINKVLIPERNTVVMNIFTGGVDITNGGSNKYLNNKNIINTENVKTYKQAMFLRDCLVKYFEVMRVSFRI
jgi:hypothetical protein